MAGRTSTCDSHIDRKLWIIQYILEKSDKTDFRFILAYISYVSSCLEQWTTKPVLRWNIWPKLKTTSRTKPWNYIIKSLISLYKPKLRYCVHKSRSLDMSNSAESSPAIIRYILKIHFIILESTLWSYKESLQVLWIPFYKHVSHARLSYMLLPPQPPSLDTT